MVRKSDQTFNPIGIITSFGLAVAAVLWWLSLIAGADDKRQAWISENLEVNPYATATPTVQDVAALYYSQNYLADDARIYTPTFTPAQTQTMIMVEEPTNFIMAECPEPTALFLL